MPSGPMANGFSVHFSFLFAFLARTLNQMGVPSKLGVARRSRIAWDRDFSCFAILVNDRSFYFRSTWAL